MCGLKKHTKSLAQRSARRPLAESAHTKGSALSAFPNIIPVVLPKVVVPKYINPNGVAGFVRGVAREAGPLRSNSIRTPDGMSGCFYISQCVTKYKTHKTGYQIVLKLFITQHEIDV